MQERQEIWVWFLGKEDPLEEEMTTHSSILAWKIPRTEGPGGLQSMGSQRVGHDWTYTHNMQYSLWKHLLIIFLTLPKPENHHKNQARFLICRVWMWQTRWLLGTQWPRTCSCTGENEGNWLPLEHEPCCGKDPRRLEAGGGSRECKEGRLMSCPGFKVSDLVRDPQGLPLEEAPTCSLLHLPQVPKSKFNQRSEKMQKQRKKFKQGKIITAIKLSQEILVPPQEL